jgi:rhodanese-related sulfurtransferase/glyoxylase-like metal-dependent hydrolase (beta-lactamase superfamily II)
MLTEHLLPLVDEGLGNSAYLLDLGDGRALAVDPPRDLRGLRAAARARGVTVAYAADTHLHADFLTGAVRLHAEDGATILASAAGARAYRHRGLHDGDEVDLGGLALRALATPGHTDEHLSFLLLDGAREVGVFTGGSLIVGAAARTDLLGVERTEELARAQFRSLRRLATLPEHAAVWPTHGAGSFCSSPAGAARTSTIGDEKRSNALLSAPDEEAFATTLRASLGSYPAYFAKLAEINRRGPAPPPGVPALPPLDPARVRRALAGGAVVLDVRPALEWAAAHLPGSVSIPLRASFATWLGWLVPDDVPVVVVRDPDQDPADILWPALNIGYELIAGELAGGVAAWRAAGGELRSTGTVGPGRASGTVLDVRQVDEYRAGHLPGALHIELGALPERSGHLDGGPVAVMCSHGERATTGASLLERAGHRGVSVVLGGGVDEWVRSTGGHPETGG